MNQAMKERVVKALRAAIVAVMNDQVLDADVLPMYFSVLDGWQHADSANDAELAMEREMDSLRSVADEGWDEGAGDVCWGIFVPVVVHDCVELGQPPTKYADSFLDYRARDWLGLRASFVPFDGRQQLARGELATEFYDGEWQVPGPRAEGEHAQAYVDYKKYSDQTWVWWLHTPGPGENRGEADTYIEACQAAMRAVSAVQALATELDLP